MRQRRDAGLCKCPFCFVGSFPSFFLHWRFDRGEIGILKCISCRFHKPVPCFIYRIVGKHKLRGGSGVFCSLRGRKQGSVSGRPAHQTVAVGLGGPGCAHEPGRGHGRPRGRGVGAAPTPVRRPVGRPVHSGARAPEGSGFSDSVIPERPPLGSLGLPAISSVPRQQILGVLSFRH